MEFTNINTLKEMGLHKIIPTLNCSAEKAYLGINVFRRDIVKCQTYTDCLDCPSFCPCNGIEIAEIHNSQESYTPNKGE